MKCLKEGVQECAPSFLSVQKGQKWSKKEFLFAYMKKKQYICTKFQDYDGN